MQQATHFDTLAGHLLAVAPSRAQELARLRVLARPDAPPTITVVGKYNHGKSRLLNELMGQDVFAVADRRETITLCEHHQADVCWMDAPGLDADVAAQDDRHAQQATWLLADIRLFVHAAREGELDAAERRLLHALHADDVRTRRRTLLVLTQVDQMADEAQLDRISAVIRSQAPDLPLHAVSATRHRSGREGGKKLLLEKSGIPALQAWLRDLLAQVPAARRHETALLFDDIGQQLQQHEHTAREQLRALQQRQHDQRQDFETGLQAVLDKIHEDLLPVLEVQGEDPALIPDSAADEFRLTAGKRERARIQVAYSRACIALRAHLIRHGVEALPTAQRTSVNSLDTVMVAVMGISIKYRADLRRIFCEQEGRQQMTQSFLHYYEISDDRQALAQAVSKAQGDVDAAARAITSLQGLCTMECA